MKDLLALVNHNKRLFYLITFLEFSFFNDAIFILFGRQYLHLSYFQAGSLFFVGYIVSIFLDFYGGVVADKMGRKHMAVMGVALQCLSNIPYLFSRSYGLLLLMSIIWGVGVALSSNTLHALMYEQTAKLKGKNAYAHISATSQIFLFAGIAIATVIGGYVYTIDPRLPYMLMTVTLLIAVVLTCYIRVADKTELTELTENTPSRIIHTAINTFRLNMPLRKFVIVSFWAGLFGDLLFAYYQPYYIDLKVSALTLGILFGTLRVASAFGSYLMRRLSDSVQPALIQAFNIVGMLVTAGLMLVLKLPLVLAAPVFLGITSGFIEPNMRLYINKHALDIARASALSVGTMIMNLGIAIGFVDAFYFADVTSSNTVLGIVIAGSAAVLIMRYIYSRQSTKYSQYAPTRHPQA